jgi:hypothetical protein
MSNPYQQYPPQQPWGPPPRQPRRRSTSKIVGLGCLGIVGLFVVIAIIAAAAGGGSDAKTGSRSVQATTSAPKTHKPGKQPAAEASKSSKPTTHKPKPDVVTFKVWGTAPPGALGPLDITYGSDSDSRDGDFRNGTFTKTLPLDDDALYYAVTAQLQGSGDIQCSVTVDGHTKKGHASGDFNICSAQLSSGLFGGWE